MDIGKLIDILIPLEQAAQGTGPYVRWGAQTACQTASEIWIVPVDDNEQIIGATNVRGAAQSFMLVQFEHFLLTTKHDDTEVHAKSLVTMTKKTIDMLRANRQLMESAEPTLQRMKYEGTHYDFVTVDSQIYRHSITKVGWHYGVD